MTPHDDEKPMNPIKMYAIFWFLIIRQMIKQKLGIKTTATPSDASTSQKPE